MFLLTSVLTFKAMEPHSGGLIHWTVDTYRICTVKTCSPSRPDRLWGPPSLLFNGYRALFLGVKRPGREADHSPLSGAKVKNSWSYTPIPQYASLVWCSVKKENIGTNLLHCKNGYGLIATRPETEKQSKLDEGTLCIRNSDV